MAIRLLDHNVIPAQFVSAMPHHPIEGAALGRPPAALRDVILLWLPEDLRTARQQPVPSVLTGLSPVAEPLPRWQPPARLLLPRQGAPAAATPVPAPPADGLPDSDFYLLAGPAEGLENLGRLRPLDAKVVAQTLAELGFLDDDDQPLSVKQLTSADQEVFLPGQVQLLLRTHRHRRRLRLLDVEAVHGLTSPQGRQIMGSFARLADRLGARLLTDADIE